MKSQSSNLNHLAIIMDGNGRWAKKRFLPRVAGHKKGMDNVKTITKAASHLGIRVLTLYAFSTENWGRPTEEVGYLMKLPALFFDKFMPELMAENVRVNVMGFLDELPQSTYDVVMKAVDQTSNNTGLVLNFALNYGARRELTQAVQEIGQQIQLGELSPSNVTEDVIEKHLLTSQFEDPDLLIRTSGEQRLSNFLLWQLAYTEFAFTDKSWPDFSKEDLTDIIEDFSKRHRRFGKL
ncbi:isoprenyl transferase [Holzapfeliella floricola]|uniref:Isoprenyl transferase n=1 Tax=Holzapfeliella floricola DSM 23037 = JCM 16512 TaxID=1423744 RepID=A0A0R2DTL8_9LACO|nr:isoprenyl transferase [Holzapfeliella floricola]KRN03802.1 di-trans,poly-cis-decaprenylcistransferase [Holzapfeliella floricola DSM 23037 = JCM 16512]